jgi:hypothetical protein
MMNNRLRNPWGRLEVEVGALQHGLVAMEDERTPSEQLQLADVAWPIFQHQRLEQATVDRRGASA